MKDAKVARSFLYAQAAQEAFTHGEADNLIRHIVGAGLAADDASNNQLWSDLALIRWVLKKMEGNRRDAEIRSVEAQNAARGLTRREEEHDDYGGIEDEEF